MARSAYGCPPTTNPRRTQHDKLPLRRRPRVQPRANLCHEVQAYLRINQNVRRRRRRVLEQFVFLSGKIGVSCILRLRIASLLSSFTIACFTAMRTKCSIGLPRLPSNRCTTRAIVVSAICSKYGSSDGVLQHVFATPCIYGFRRAHAVSPAASLSLRMAARSAQTTSLGNSEHSELNWSTTLDLHCFFNRRSSHSAWF